MTLKIYLPVRLTLLHLCVKILNDILNFTESEDIDIFNFFYQNDPLKKIETTQLQNVWSFVSGNTTDSRCETKTRHVPTQPVSRCRNFAKLEKNRK